MLQFSSMNYSNDKVNYNLFRGINFGVVYIVFRNEWFFLEIAYVFVESVS